MSDHFVPRAKLRKAVQAENPTPPSRRNDGVPSGFIELPRCRVYLNPVTGVVVVTGMPDEDRDPTGEMHNCDEWGCNWEHVFGRFNLGERERAHMTVFYGGFSDPRSDTAGGCSIGIDQGTETGGSR